MIRTVLPLLVLIGFFQGATVLAVSKADIQNQIRIAGFVIENRMASAKPVPNDILEEARCIAALRIVKIGFIIGGQGSAGAVSCRNDGEWGAPSFFHVNGVNFGIQIGVQFLESVLVFMTDEAQDILSRPSIKVGTDLSFAVGPTGEGSGTGPAHEAQVLSYSRSGGLYAGATIEGSMILHNQYRNAYTYGNGISPVEVLSTSKSEANALVVPYIELLEEIAPGAY